MTQAYQLGDLGQLLTVDAVGNNITLAANSVVVGNASVNATINSTAFTGTANNTSFVGTVSAANVVSNAQLTANLANYQTTAGLSANVATLSSNNASYLGGVAAASYVNTSGAYTRTGVTTFSANLIISTTAGISANGSFGTANQVLTSNGSTVYWSTVSGGGGGSVNVAAQYTWTNTQTFTNTITFSSTINGTANNTSYVGSVTAANVVSNAQLQSNLSNYQTTAGLSANVATLAANSSTYANQSITNTFTVGTAAYHVSNGNMGIGTSTPAYKLDVNGSGRIQGLFFSASGDQYLYDSGGGSATIRAGTGGTDVYYAFYANGQFAALGGGGYFNGNLNVSGNISIAGNQAVNGPSFSAYQSSSQSISSGVSTKVQLQSKEWDTNSCFDATTNYRFTPTVAGYYQISAGINFTTLATSITFASIFKNGVEYKRLTQTYSSVYGIEGSAIVYLNGTTDYVELYCFQYNGSSISLSTGVNLTYFQGAMVRGA